MIWVEFLLLIHYSRLLRPKTQCFPSGGYQQFKRHTVLERGFEVGRNLSDPRTRERLLEQQREADALYKTQFEVCRGSLGDDLKYMGTSTVARDIDFITTALEGKDALMLVSLAVEEDTGVTHVSYNTATSTDSAMVLF